MVLVGLTLLRSIPLCWGKCKDKSDASTLHALCRKQGVLCCLEDIFFLGGKVNTRFRILSGMKTPEVRKGMMWGGGLFFFLAKNGVWSLERKMRKCVLCKKKKKKKKDAQHTHTQG